MARAFAAVSAQYLEAAAAVVADEPFTVSLWFYAADTLANYDLWSMMNSSLTNEGHIINLFASGPTVRAGSAAKGSFSLATTSTTYSTTTWHHVCAVFTSDTSRDVYLDGGGVGNDTATRAVTSLDVTDLARRGDSTPSGHLSGRLAEFGMWDVALDTAEIASLAAGFAPPLVRSSSLAAYVPLVRDADDDLVGGLSFAPSSSPTIQAHPRIIYPAKRVMVAPPTIASTIPPLTHSYTRRRIA